MAALGSTLLTMGERTETAGTAVNAMAQKLAAADKGTKKFHAAVSEIGLSTRALQKGMQTDAMGTILKVLDAVNKLNPEKRLGVLVEMFGLEHSDTIAKLATNTAELRKQLDLANSSAAKGSMTREFSARMATTAAQAQLAKNRVIELGIAIGSVLLPSINSTLGAIGPVITKMAEWAEQYPMVTKSIVGLGTVLIGLRISIFAVRLAWLTLSGLMLTNPIMAAITGLAMGAMLIVQNWTPLSAFFKSMWTDITGAFNMAVADIMRGIEWVTQKYKATRDFLGGSFLNFGGGAVDMPGGQSLPSPAPTGRGGGQYHDSSQTTINVTQKPGEDSDKFAKRVAEEIERSKTGRGGWAAMYDGAYAQ